MRHFAVSVLSVLLVFPAFADARLPVVNLAAGGVSARAAFGEPVVKINESQSGGQDIALNNDVTDTDVILGKSHTEIRPDVNVTHGGPIVAAADVLSPHRPSSDLWAHSDTSVGYTDAPLRLPSPDEFSVIRSDDILPEESLIGAPRATTTIARNDNERQIANRVPTYDAYDTNVTRAVSQPLSEIDAQIARLNELQRRADASVMEQQNLEPVAPRAVAHETRSVVARPSVKKQNVVRDINADTRIASKNNNDSDVTLSRVVVPMVDDVVVRAVEKSESPRIASVRDDMTKMSPSELRKAFRKTFLSENKHLSAFQIDDRFDVASDVTANAAGFTSARDLSEAGGIRPLEIKIKFRNEDSALSRDNYNLLTEYAGIVLSNPTRAVQVSIPESVTRDADDRKLAARRLAIVEQVLRDNGISEQRILPVLSQRDDSGLVLRMISLDQYETLTQQQRDIFGDTVSKKTYRSMSW